MTIGNPLKDRLLAGEMQVGAWLNMTSTSSAEIVGGCGFDWCLIDAEHGANTIGDVRDQLIALKAAGCPSAVRVADNESWLLKQALDVGAQTVLVPMVNTAAEAKAAALAVRYPPEGARGLAAGVVRASGFGANGDYMNQANNLTCLMVQAETQAAVDNADAIAGVDGVDCVFIGPSDLAADMGFLGNPEAPEVQKAIAHVMARTKSAGKAVGMFCLTPSDLPLYRDMGATFIAVASDVASFRATMVQRVNDVRAALK